MSFYTARVISGQQTSCRGVEDVRFTRKSGHRSGYFRRQALGERRHRGLARRATAVRRRLFPVF